MSKKWSDQELQKFIEIYPSKGAKYCADLFQRTFSAVCHKASRLGLTLNPLFSDEEILFLKQNYTTKGSKYCSEKLNKTRFNIINTANRMGLKIDKETKSKLTKVHFYEKSRNYKINPNVFIHINNPEIAYLLGLLWADGNISKTNNTIQISLIEDDAKILLPTINKFGEWGLSKYKPKNKNSKILYRLSISNPIIHNFLKENDYLTKSGSSPEKILGKIPSEMRHYFFRGYLDGDGCIYFNQRTKRGNLSFYSVLEQDWKFILSLCQELNITGTVSHDIREGIGASSYFRIHSMKSVIILCKYIYLNYLNDNIGLARKYSKYITILNSMIKSSN